MFDKKSAFVSHESTIHSPRHPKVPTFTAARCPYLSKMVTHVLLEPESLDSTTRKPHHIAQGPLDATRVLRVVYRIEYDTMVVITFYPGKRSRYEED